MQYKDFIIEILNEVSKIARDNFGKVTGKTKKDDNNQVLTETDLSISKAIISHIRKEFPQHNLIDEETGIIDNHSNLTWIIDPIDGTSNFASGVPTYGIMLGLLDGGSLIAGGIALPSFNEIYWALKGNGAFCNGKKINVTTETNLSSVLVSYGIDGYKNDPDKTKEECDKLADIIFGIRNLRSSNSCFDVAMVAKGNYGAWLNKTQKIWDNVVEQIIIEEAGGKVTDFYGQPLTYENPLINIETTFTMCAASPPLHNALQKIIHKE